MTIEELEDIEDLIGFNKSYGIEEIQTINYLFKNNIIDNDIRCLFISQLKIAKKLEKEQQEA